MRVMLKIAQSAKFKKDLKKIRHQPKVLASLEKIIDVLCAEVVLAKKYCDHALVGDWVGYRECHVLPDLLLIYKVEDEVKLLRLARVGNHAALFG